MRPCQIIPGRHVIRINVGKIWLVLAAQGRWGVWLGLSTHIQTRWRVLAVVFVGMSLEGAGVLVQVVRRVIVLFPIHDCHRPGKPCCTRAHEPAPCPWSGPLLYLQSERLAPIEGLIGVPPWPCDPAAPLVSLFTQSCQLAVDSVRVSFLLPRGLTIIEQNWPCSNQCPWQTLSVCLRLYVLHLQLLDSTAKTGESGNPYLWSPQKRLPLFNEHRTGIKKGLQNVKTFW